MLLLVSDIRYGHGARVTNILCCSDPKGYYMYLPAVFIYKDIHSVPDVNFQGRTKNEKGESYTKYTCGTAYFYLPFFLCAHLYAHWVHADTSGFSAPYCYGIMLCGVFWAVVGIFFLKTLLLKYFSRSVTWVTMFCLITGTNFFNYATLDIGMSHVYNFTLFAAAVLITDLYYKDPTKGKAMLLGLLLGWIALSRPTNSVMFLFLFLYRVVNKDDLKKRLIFLKEHITDVLIAIPFFIAIWLPQLLYWKAMTGRWVIDSYEGEHFIYWSHPKVLSVLFDTQNGLLLYSPILLFLFWALLRKWKDARTNVWGTSIVFIIITYLFASWWVWWFGGAFGHRCYVDYYPLLVFSLAVTIESIVKLKNLFIKIPVFILILLFCYYSIALSELYMVNGRCFDGPEWRWNWDTWLGLVRSIF